MATAKKLLDAYYNIYQRKFPRSTLTKWIKEGKVKATELPPEERKGGRKYDYDLDSFLKIINSDEYKTKLKASKKNPKDFIGKTNGYLLIKGIVPKKEYNTNYKGTLMYCDCLKCGKQNIQVRFSYLSGNGNYNQKSCGCDRKKEAFKATTIMKKLDDSFLDQFEDFERFLLIHRSLRSNLNNFESIDIDDYKKLIIHFYNNKQFNDIYNFWMLQNKTDTFYDWAKPSVDHIIPKAKGGTNDIDNLQFLTVFENLNKRDMTMKEWERFKKNTHTTSDYFYESIKEVMR